MELKGTQTEKNLAAAFAGESQARNKYNYFASRARKDGLEVIARIFDETAENEKEHAKLWCKHLDGIGDTPANLLSAAAGEHHEWTKMYKKFADVAAKEGFAELSAQFAHIASIEKMHEDRYLVLSNALKDGSLFSKGTEVVWECLNCGKQITNKNAPAVCPACFHPKGYFKAL